MKWSYNALRALFRYLPSMKHNEKTVGIFDFDTWSVKPKHFSIKEWNIISQTLLHRLIKENVFPDNWRPKSYKAVEHIIAHAVYPGNHPRYRGLRSRVRLVAYNEGFMGMYDIVRLEQAARERHGHRVFIESGLVENDNDSDDNNLSEINGEPHIDEAYT